MSHNTLLQNLIKRVNIFKLLAELVNELKADERGESEDIKKLHATEVQNKRAGIRRRRAKVSTW